MQRQQGDGYSLSELGLVGPEYLSEFDELVALASDVLDAPVSLMSIVEPARDRQFFTSHEGLEEPWRSRRQTPLSHSFCRHVVEDDAAFAAPLDRRPALYVGER